MRIFSYLVNVPEENPRGHGEEIPGRVSCNSSEGNMRVITNSKNLISKMSDYFNYLARAAHAEDDLEVGAGAGVRERERDRDGVASARAFNRMVRSPPRTTRGNWTSPYLDSCGLGIVITYAVPVISWHTNQYARGESLQT